MIKKIALFIGMIIIFALCFSIVSVIADPVNPEESTTASPDSSLTTGPTDTALPSQGTAEHSPSPETIKPSKTPMLESPSSTPTIKPSTAPPVIVPDFLEADMFAPLVSEIEAKGDIYNSNMEKNLNGYVIRIAASWNEKNDKNLNMEAIAAFEKKYNCKVAFLDLTREVLLDRLLISCSTGITYFDAILTDSANILVNFEPLGLLDEFSKYMTAEELAKVPMSYQKILASNNKLYGIQAHAPDFMGVWSNRTLIDTHSLINPYAEYSAGNWNWKTLVSVMEEAIGDKNGDGEVDVWGVATAMNIYTPIVESFGGSVFRWTGTEFVSGLSKNVTVGGIGFVRDVYLERYFSYDYESYFYLNQSTLLLGKSSMYSDLKRYLGRNELMFLPYPTFSGKDNIATAAYADCVAIVKNSRYPAHTAELLKTLYLDDFEKRIETFCVDNEFTKQTLTIYKSMLNNFTVDYTDAFDMKKELENQILSLIKNETAEFETSIMNINVLIDNFIARRNKQIDLKNIPVQIKW